MVNVEVLDFGRTIASSLFPKPRSESVLNNAQSLKDANDPDAQCMHKPKRIVQ